MGIDGVKKLVDFSKYRAKIKGDVGRYNIYGIDCFNYKLLVDRSCGIEWVGFSDIERIIIYK